MELEVFRPWSHVHLLFRQVPFVQLHDGTGCQPGEIVPKAAAGATLWLKRKGRSQYFPIFEDDRGTYILHSKDLNMLAHLPELAAAGIDSLKIEGRMKSVYYVATVVWAYRQALDAYHADPEGFSVKAEWLESWIRSATAPIRPAFISAGRGLMPSHTRAAAMSATMILSGWWRTAGCASRIAVRNRIRLGDSWSWSGPGSPA